MAAQQIGHSEKSIEDWMVVFDRIYGEVNKARSPAQMWLSVMAHCSAMGEGIRTVHYEDVLREAAHAFEWMCAFVTKLNALPENHVFSFRAPFSDIIAIKYPNVCGHCVSSPCRCNTVEMDAQADKAGRYSKLYSRWKQHIESWRTFKFSDWVASFDSIYRQNVHLLTLDMIGFHFLEETGEAAHAVKALSEMETAGDFFGGDIITFARDLTSVEGLMPLSWHDDYKAVVEGKEPLDPASTDILAIKKRLVYSKIHLVTEFADTFAWMCSLLKKIDIIAKTNGAQLPLMEQTIEAEYQSNDGNRTWICPTCKQAKCAGEFYCR